MSAVSVAVVPGVWALLPEYASAEDPVAELRSACLAAAGALGPRVAVIASGPDGERVGRSLLDVGTEPVGIDDEPTGLLVVGNGTAKRTEKAPGHFDARAEAFDDALRASLLAHGGAVGLDADLAEELWADIAALAWLAEAVVPVPGSTRVHYDDAPYGVCYLVASWEGKRHVDAGADRAG